MVKFEKSIGQCIGLWLAEGDLTSTSEITFTNNRYYLIKFFHTNLNKTLKLENKPRIYVYAPSKYTTVKLQKIKELVHRFYIDKRANRPYFIYRVSGKKAVKEWLTLVKKITPNKKFYPYLLQGIFAGEGNIKYIEKSKSRVIRISQGKRSKLIEDILNYSGIKYSYSKKERSYVISGRENLEKLIRIDISCLHREKNFKLKHMFSTYKQYHYPRGELKNMILNILREKPSTSLELSKLFKRDQTRVIRVLTALKRDRKIKNYRVGSTTYWVLKNSRLIIISDIKNTILNHLNMPRRTSEIAKLVNRDWKSSSKRLKELKKLNLVKYSGGLWYKLPNKGKVIVHNINNRYR